MKSILAEIIIVILIFFSSAGISAADLACSVCKDKIGANRRYLESSGRIFCSENCFDKYRKSFWKSCTACGVKAPEGVVSDGKFYCSERCLKSVQKKCANCNEGVLSGVSYSDEFILCMKCDKLPKCDLCMKPRKQNGKLLSDGLSLCKMCLDNGIFDLKKGKPYFEKVRSILRDKLKLSTDNNIALSICNASDVHNSDKPFTVDTELGLYKYSGEYNVDTGKVLFEKFEILILHGLSPEKFEIVAAHELAHDWMRKNVPHIKNPLLVEGFAEYISWRYARLMNYNKAAARIENNKTPIYGDGFRNLKRSLDNLKNPTQYKNYFRSFNE